MPFDFEKFNKMKFDKPKAMVPVPEISYLFKGDPEWEVTMLGALEIAQVEQAVEANTNLDKMLSMFFSDQPEDSINAIKKKLGVISEEDLPKTYVKCLEKIKRASTEKFDKPTLVSIGQKFPAVFFRVAVKVDELSNIGCVEKKKASSIKKKT